MNRKLAIIVMAGLAVLPATVAQAQTGGAFEDALTTWVPYNPDPTAPAGPDPTLIDFASDPIPADFFGPGSDPFDGIVELRGYHNGPNDIDTIVRRIGGDPFDKRDPPDPDTSRTIGIEMVALNLVSIEPMEVTNGPYVTYWDVELDLSPPPTVQPQGTMTVTKTHPNGGFFDSSLPLLPRLRFTRRDNGDTRELDWGLDDLPPIVLETRNAPWVHNVFIPDVIVDPNSQFHPAVNEDESGEQYEEPFFAQTPPAAEGPIVIHYICLPKPVKFCIYQITCKSAIGDTSTGCGKCPYDCDLCRFSKCPNDTCATGFTTKCKGECCLTFEVVDCRAPAGEPYCPKVTETCNDCDTGACCQADGICEETTECECDGAWMGAGTVCGPTQACCLADGTCMDNVAQICCELMKGGTSVAGACSGVIGKCCHDDGNCEDGVDETCCDTGFFIANGVCQTPQECCFGTQCIMMDPECCELMGGISGPGVCDPPQACCMTDGSCVNTDPFCCQQINGTPAAGQCQGDSEPNGIDDACEGTDPDVCPLGTSFCTPLQDPQCLNGLPGEDCWAVSATVNNVHVPIATECACASDGCGPYDIEWLPAINDYGFRCLFTCPDPAVPCLIHLNGVPTASGAILASQVAAGVDVTCNCLDQTPDPCPLPFVGGVVPDCANRQQTDCKDGQANEECLPLVVVITSNGVPIAKTCACFEGDLCGPPDITGDIVSCAGDCPVPPGGICVVHANGVSTGMVSVHMGDVPVGADLTCGCSEPQVDECLPNDTETDCDPFTCPIAGEECRPKCITVDPLTGISRVTDCDCVGSDECHAEIGAAGPVCVNDCPPGQVCIGTLTTNSDGTETLCCDCVALTTCQPTADKLDCEPTICPDPAEVCRPTVIELNPNTGDLRVVKCECTKECHVEISPPPAEHPYCVGDCPTGEICELFTTTTADGTLRYKCDCVPIEEECAPNDAKTDCKPVTCPKADEICRPTSITWIQGTPPVINACDCINPEEQCHIEYDAATGPFCVGDCPLGEICELFGHDTDGNGEPDLWKCACVPIQLECGPDSTEQFCNPVPCPNADEFCVPIVIVIDPVNGQVRVKECECIAHGTGIGCHVTYNPASLQPFCEGDCPPGQACELFGTDLNGDGIDDQFKCDCVDDPIDCAPDATGSQCNPVACPILGEFCQPKIIQLLPGTTTPVIVACDCDGDTDCHIEYNAAQGPHCVGGCPAGQNCVLRSVDTDGDGIDDFFACDCDPDQGDVCEPNATGTGCKPVTCPVPGEVCRPTLLGVGPNGQVVVKKCECLDVDDDCHMEVDAAGNMYCHGACPPGEKCELLGIDVNNDGTNDVFKCACVPPDTECEPDASGLDCLPTICPVPGEICRPKVITWHQGADPIVEECECFNPDKECHVEFDPVAQVPVCVGECPPGEECTLFNKAGTGGIADRWECDCVPIGPECAPNADGTACPSVCPNSAEICVPSVITLVQGGLPKIEECDCIDPNVCHLEYDAASAPICVGDCPPGQICELFTLTMPDGSIRHRCDCIPIELFCEPTADGQYCNDVLCPDPNQKCVPTHVSCIQDVGCIVISCECIDPEPCHVELAPPLTSPPVVCVGVCPPGYKCILRGVDTNNDGIKDLFDCRCAKIPPIIVVGPVIKGNRYLSVLRPPPSVAGGAPSEAIRVRSVLVDGYPAFNDEVRWLGAPGVFPEENSGQPALTFNGSRLECAALFDDWTQYGAVQVYGGGLVPQSQYSVQVVDVSCPDLDNDECYSTPVIISTGKFGDIWPPFDDPQNPPEPSFKDIAAMVQKFQATPNACTGGANDRLVCTVAGDCPGGSCDITAPLKAKAQLQPNTPFPDRAIDFKDIALAVSAFVDDKYSDLFDGPCACPSLVTCDTTACTNDLACGGGLCVDGFCRDACQRCTP